MTAIDGFRLEFSDGTVFRATENIGITHNTQPLYLIDGLRNFLRLYNEYISQGGQPGRSGSNYSGVFYGFGAGIHTIQIEFINYKGNTTTWGSTSASDSALTKMGALNRAITTTKADSEAPALLEVGEYNDPANHSGVSASDYDPIPVAMAETGLTYRVGEGESPVVFSGSLQCYDAIDVGQAVDAIFRE